MTDQVTVRILGTGTSQGIPVIGCGCSVCCSSDVKDNRLRTSASIESSNTRVIIDIGPDFRQQLLRAGINDIDALLLTHEHNDHVSGLDEVRPINFLQRKNIPLFALPRVLGEVRSRFPYIFDNDSKYPGRPRVELCPVDREPFIIGDLEVHPVPVKHGPLPILGYRVGNFCYITDANAIDDQTIADLGNLDVLILNALHRREHFSHFNLDQAVEMSGKIGARRTYFTHLSHDMGLHEVVSEELPDGVALAHDGMVLKIAN